MQISERLELPLTTYRALEEIAQVQGGTPADAVDNLIRRFHHAERLTALREEYQQLASKELAHSLTPEEAVRLEVVAAQLSDIEMESEANSAWEKQAENMNALLQELKCTLLAFPDKEAPAT